MKKVLVLFCLISQIALASILDDSKKIYPKDADILFMSALSAISSCNKFEISEIQTRNGYILFTYNSKYYLLTLTKRYKNQTEIKVLPQNSDYSQGSTVAHTVFTLIDEQLKTKPLELVK